MAMITFKAKAHKIYTVEGAVAYEFVKVPTLARAHCDMEAFRRHPKFGGLANSDLFANLLARIKKERLGEVVRLDKVPPGVEVNQQAFLTVVSFEA